MCQVLELRVDKNKMVACSQEASVLQGAGKRVSRVIRGSAIRQVKMLQGDSGCQGSCSEKGRVRGSHYG